jgi:NADH-quinone oxidoreductase subunit E
MTDQDTAKVDEIINSYGARSNALIAILQDIQANYRYLPREALDRVSESLEVPLSRIYSVATFYKAFSLEPKGEYEIHVCLGTACHLRGGPRIVERIERELGIEPGQTTGDNKFTLSTVNCLGACALAPLVRVNEDNHGKMNVSAVKKLLGKYRDQ